jgi:hypothetical protein
MLYIVKDFNILINITLNKDLIFTSKFWVILYFYLKIRR